MRSIELGHKALSWFIPKNPFAHHCLDLLYQQRIVLEMTMSTKDTCFNMSLDRTDTRTPLCFNEGPNYWDLLYGVVDKCVQVFDPELGLTLAEEMNTLSIRRRNK